MEKKTNTLEEIDLLAKDYANASQVLSDRIMGLEDEFENVKRKHLPSIINAVNKAKSTKELLYGAIDISRHLFDKPKTFTLNGIKCDLQKGRDAFVWENEEQVIRRIKKSLLKHVDSLINTKESIAKSGLKQLTPDELKRLELKYLLVKSEF